MVKKNPTYYKILHLTVVVLVLCGLGTGVVKAQSGLDSKFTFDGSSSKKVVIPFELINNLIIIEASINGSEPLKLILDTGVANTLITGLPNNEELYLENTEKISIVGLGEDEPLEAFYSKNNNLNLDGVTGENLDIIILTKDAFNLSSFMGTFVHGLIGYDVFAHFAVEINYQTQLIYLYDPDSFRKKFERLPKHRKWNKINFNLLRQKPYINIEYRHSEEDTSQELKLLIDSGASNAFTLFEMTSNFIDIPKANIETLLGVGLSGAVNGKLGRVSEVSLGSYTFREPVVAYPDSNSVKNALSLSDYNGSMGGEILRRFKVIFHYQQRYLLVRANSNFKDEFSYNKGGIELITPIPNLPLYVISNVRPGSPADIAGIKRDDVIKKLNNKNVEEFSFSELLYYLEGKEGSRIRLEVQRDTTFEKFQFNLRDELEVD